MSKAKLIYSKKHQHVFKYQVSKGFKWGYRYRYYDQFHERKEASRRSFNTEKEAYAALLEVQQNIITDHVDTVSNINTTFAEWTKIWFEANQDDWAISTRISVKGMLNNHILPLLGKQRLSGLTRIKYQTIFINKIKKYSPSTQRTWHQRVLSIINSAVENDVIPANKLTRFGFGKSEEKVIMSSEQLTYFLTEMKKSARADTRMLFSLLAYTGIRKGEALALTWNDIDLKNSVISITKTRDEYGVRKPKTASSVRKVPFGSDLRKEILLYKQYQWQAYNAHSRKFKNDELLIQSINGKLPDSAGVNRRLQRMLKLVGMEDLIGKFTIHSFRHTHATLLIDAGLPVKTVSKRLGHSNVETTFKYYVHDLPGRQEEAAAKFDEIMSEKII